MPEALASIEIVPVAAPELQELSDVVAVTVKSQSTVLDVPDVYEPDEGLESACL